MNYPIPADPQAVVALRQKTVDEELIAAVIIGVIKIARSKGQSLEDLKAEVLHDDALLELGQRRWLGELVAETWQKLPQ
jgi:hypothetical protein